MGRRRGLGRRPVVRIGGDMDVPRLEIRRICMTNTLPFRHDTDPVLLADPFGTWDRLREEEGAFLSDQAEAHGVWFLLKYDDIHTAMQDPATFSSEIITPGYGASESASEPAAF